MTRGDGLRLLELLGRWEGYSSDSPVKVLPVTGSAHGVEQGSGLLLGIEMGEFYRLRSKLDFSDVMNFNRRALAFAELLDGVRFQTASACGLGGLDSTALNRLLERQFCSGPSGISKTRRFRGLFATGTTGNLIRRDSTPPRWPGVRLPGEASPPRSERRHYGASLEKVSFGLKPSSALNPAGADIYLFPFSHG